MTVPPTQLLPRSEGSEGVEARILDAALVRFEAVGIKKTTIEDIARQAGVDRVTVYRRMGSRDDLVQAVIRREATAFLAEIADMPDRHDNAEGLVADILVTIVTRWRENRFLQRMLLIEPGRFMMKLTSDGEALFAMSIMTTADALKRAADRGIVPDAPDLMARAEVVCRVVHSLLIAPHGVIDLGSEKELTELAHKLIVPIVTGGR